MDEEDEQFFDIERALKNKRKGGRLENWIRDAGMFDGVERSVFWGNVYDDSNFLPGSWIHTSEVMNYHVDLDLVETKNTYYTLGEPKVIIERTPEEQEAFDKELAEAAERLSYFII